MMRPNQRTRRERRLRIEVDGVVEEAEEDQEEGVASEVVEDGEVVEDSKAFVFTGRA
jgi:hypothetical protein